MKLQENSWCPSLNRFPALQILRMSSTFHHCFCQVGIWKKCKNCWVLGLVGIKEEQISSLEVIFTHGHGERGLLSFLRTPLKLIFYFSFSCTGNEWTLYKGGESCDSSYFVMLPITSIPAGQWSGVVFHMLRATTSLPLIYFCKDKSSSVHWTAPILHF